MFNEQDNCLNHWISGTVRCIKKKKNNSKTDTLNWSEVCLGYCLKASTFEVDNYVPNIIDKYIPIDVVFHHYITPQKQSQNYVCILSPLIVGIHKHFQFAI